MNGNGNIIRRSGADCLSMAALGLAIVLLIAIGVFAATRGGTKIDPSKLAKVEKGDLAKSVVATGKVTPITKVEVKSKASGIVKKLLVDYGDHVKKGPTAGATRQGGDRSAGGAVARGTWMRPRPT